MNTLENNLEMLANCYVAYLRNPRVNIDGKINDHPSLMGTIMKSNSNYSEIFDRCIETVINVENERFKKTSIYMIMIRKDLPFFNEIPEIFYNILKICNQIHSLSCGILKADIKDFERELSFQKRIQELDVQILIADIGSREIEKKKKEQEMQRKLRKQAFNDSYCTLL